MSHARFVHRVDLTTINRYHPVLVSGTGRRPDTIVGVCGRYGEMADAEHWRERFGTAPPVGRTAQSQLAPTDSVAVVSHGEQARMDRWGLLPHWAMSLAEARKKAAINARLEGLATQPMFRVACRRRVLVPATHYFEWRREEARRVPFLIRRRDRDLMAFAGIESGWRDPATGDEITSMAIVTTASDGPMAALHSRMPVVLMPEQEGIWLDPAQPVESVLAQLRPLTSSLLTAVPVGSDVNSVRHRAASIVDEVGPPLF